MSERRSAEAIRTEEWVTLYRKRNPEADRWAVGYGPIHHALETQARVFSMAELLAAREVKGDGVPLFDLLRAADRVASAAMWLVAHETYAQNVYLDGRDLAPDDFKPRPEGHTGGALNMVPAYTGYMAVDAITGRTRSWIMGQGHCVAAIDSANVLLDNMTEAHAERYSVTDEGLTRYVRDFYSYRLREDGTQDSPLGSHVNAHTAGGLAEGGVPGVHRAAVRPHAAPRRAAGGVSQRWGVRGATRQRLGAPLVATRRLRSGDPDHDQQRPPHRPEDDDVSAGRLRLAC